MMKYGLVVLGVLGMLSTGLVGCNASAYDVELSAPDLDLDLINPQLPRLVAALPQHAQANTFRLSYRIVPTPSHPLEAIPHFLIYNRKAKTLEVHRDEAYYEVFSGVTDTVLAEVAAKGGGVRTLLRVGCKRTSPLEIS